MTARALQWTGASDHATFNTPGNWNDLTNGGVASGTTPVTGDTCHIVDTSDTINAGLSQTAVQLALLNVGTNFTGQIGPNGSPLIIGADALQYSGRASYFGITAGTGGITAAVIAGQNTVTFTGGTTAKLSTGPGGNVYIAAAGIVTNYKGAGGSGVAEAGTAFTTFKCGAGSFVSARSLGTGDISGQGTQVKTILAAGSTSIDVHGGATWVLNATGTNVAVEALSGSTLTSKGAILPPVITTLTKHAGASTFANEMIAANVTTMLLAGQVQSE